METINLYHTPEITLMDTGSFCSLMFNAYRFETIIIYGIIGDLIPYYEIQDLWLNKSYRVNFSKDELDTIIPRIKLELERLAYAPSNKKFKAALDQFLNREHPTFTDQLKDQLFDAWHYNNELFIQVLECNMSCDDVHKQYTNATADFGKMRKYYYNRSTNSVELLEAFQVNNHEHFWIQIDYDGNDVKSVLEHCFGEQLANNMLQSTLGGYFDHKSYTHLLEIVATYKQTDSIVPFQRIMAENWLSYINQHFIIPPSFANRNHY